jgi:hypothetical protein
MIIFFSGTGVVPTAEVYQKDIDVMMTFYDMYDKPPLPKFRALCKVRKRKLANGDPLLTDRPQLKKKGRKRP